ncbi:Otopetrin-1 [Orchesella cincta]|uniref:Otopetrin-1 n=1 Tax=Orchesella cincta TaxID=48709 RepID=A0A1D2N8J4_ORCCI|nr:Otopetrin-1 [Orchesella cincta]
MGWLFSHVIKKRAKKKITRGVNSIKSRLQSPNKAVTEGGEASSEDELADPAVLYPETDNEAGIGSDLENSKPSKEVTSCSHSEDSDDQLTPLPTDEGGNKTPLMPRQMANNHPTILIQPMNSHLHPHPHNLHVTINSVPGHDGMPTTPPLLHMSNMKKSNIILEALEPPKTKGKLSRTQSVESSKYDSSSGQRSHFGSFYLRMGAVAFGVGSMIYSCLEFGQSLEQGPDTKCHSYMQAITPVVRIVFTFMQMYFIFLNSSMSVSKVSWVKQFGLMHLIGTNLCVWLNVLVQETKHEILHFYDPENGTITVGYGLNYYGKPKKLEEHNKVMAAATSSPPSYPPSALVQDDHDVFLSMVNSTANILSGNGHGVIHRLKRGLKGPHSIYECARENIMGSLVNSASPFLFPCTIEYSLICAAICYVMWKSMAKRRVRQITLKRTMTADSTLNQTEARNVHHYTVDCAGSNKGLFIGIFFLVGTIMSLILNFVLMKHHEHMEFAFWEVNMTEITLYAVSTLAVLIGMCQMRQLRYESGKNLELDNILLIVAQSGSFMFNVFCIVGGQLTPLESNPWILVTPLLCLIQLLLQTLFILDASKRVIANSELARRKPGREIVTFLLVTNLAMWLINALEKSRGDSHPHLLRFFGVWAWTIITDISMPLAIFYRFHSTVCLCEIWKKAYKARKFDSDRLQI